MKINVNVKTSDVTDYGYHTKLISTTTDWQEYSFSLCDISKPTWAIETLLDPAHITGIEWLITADNSGTPSTGSLVIDDIYFE